MLSAAAGSMMTSAPAPVGETLDLRADVDPVPDERLFGAQLLDGPGIVLAGDRRQHARTQGAGDLHGGAADSPRGSLDEHGLTRLHRGPADQGIVSRGEDERHGGRLLKGQRGRLGDGLGPPR